MGSFELARQGRTDMRGKFLISFQGELRGSDPLILVELLLVFSSNLLHGRPGAQHSAEAQEPKPRFCPTYSDIPPSIRSSPAPQELQPGGSRKDASTCKPRRILSHPMPMRRLGTKDRRNCPQGAPQKNCAIFPVARELHAAGRWILESAQSKECITPGSKGWRRKPRAKKQTSWRPQWHLQEQRFRSR
jgi:hypothetical protein